MGDELLLRGRGTEIRQHIHVLAGFEAHGRDLVAQALGCGIKLAHFGRASGAAGGQLLSQEHRLLRRVGEAVQDARAAFVGRGERIRDVHAEQKACLGEQFDKSRADRARQLAARLVQHAGNGLTLLPQHGGGRSARGWAGRVKIAAQPIEQPDQRTSGGHARL